LRIAGLLSTTPTWRTNQQSIFTELVGTVKSTELVTIRYELIEADLDRNGLVGSWIADPDWDMLIVD
jgi:hypothetical protein